MTSIIEQLKQFAEDDPNDPFNFYALALEYQKFDIPKALAMFKNLVATHPQYVPTYYQLGKLCQQNGDVELAKETFEKGMSVAAGMNNHKTYRELQSALRELEEEL